MVQDNEAMSECRRLVGRGDSVENESRDFVWYFRNPLRREMVPLPFCHPTSLKIGYLAPRAGAVPPGAEQERSCHSPIVDVKLP